MRKRSKYRPKPVSPNPVAYVLEGMAPVASHTGYLVDLKIKNNDAMVKLLRGEATRADMDTIIAMSNIVEALVHHGFGQEYGEVALGGREAIIGIAHRSVKAGKFVPTGPEINALNLLMELHDAQMDIITVRDMDKALGHVKSLLKQRKATALPTIRTEGA